MTLWTNWAGNLSCDTDITTPTTLAELQTAVSDAAAQGKRVRVAGGSYSWSELIPCPELIIKMHKLDKFIDFDNSGPEPIVEIQCGMTIEKLTEIVDDLGMTLITPTLFPKPTVGGAVAPGCHGTSSAVGNFSDQIESMLIVMADGTTKKVTKAETTNFRAAKCALGSLGVIFSIRLRVRLQFNVYVDKRRVPVKYVLEEFQDLHKTYEFLEIFWFPLQSDMWLYLMNRTDSWPDPKTAWSKFLVKLNTWIENTAGGILIPWLAVNAPQATPILNKLGSYLSNKVEVKVQTASDAFHYQKAYPLNWDLSYAVPVEYATRAWSEAIELVEEYAEANMYPVNLALHCRVTGESDSFISPDTGRTTLYIEVTTAKDTPGWEEFFKEMERRWIAIPGSRPHWSKLNFRPKRIKAEYPLMDDFLEVREDWDPKRVFLNHYLEFDVFQLGPLPMALEERAPVLEPPPAPGP